MASSVPFKRLENKTRGDAVSYTGLDNIPRSKVTSQTPYRPYESGIPVVPRSEAPGPGSNPFCFELSHYFVPQDPKFLNQVAWPPDAQAVMELAFPVFIVLVFARRSALLALSQV